MDRGGEIQHHRDLRFVGTGRAGAAIEGVEWLDERAREDNGSA